MYFIYLLVLFVEVARYMLKRVTWNFRPWLILTELVYWLLDITRLPFISSDQIQLYSDLSLQNESFAILLLTVESANLLNDTEVHVYIEVKSDKVLYDIGYLWEIGFVLENLHHLSEIRVIEVVSFMNAEKLIVLYYGVVVVVHIEQRFEEKYTFLLLILWKIS